MTFPKKTMASYHTKTKQEERKKVENQPMHKSKTGEREREKKRACLHVHTVHLPVAGEHALDLRLACVVLEVATENWSYSRHT